MRQIVVTVPDERAESVEQWLTEQGIAFSPQMDDGIPDWHKAILLERLQNPAPGPLLTLEESLAEIDLILKMEDEEKASKA